MKLAADNGDEGTLQVRMYDAVCTANRPTINPKGYFTNPDYANDLKRSSSLVLADVVCNRHHDVVLLQGAGAHAEALKALGLGKLGERTTVCFGAERTSLWCRCAASARVCMFLCVHAHLVLIVCNCNSQRG